MDLFELLATPVQRAGAAAQNALEVARFGGIETGEEPSPFEVVVHEPVYRLRRYFPGEVARGAPAIVLVPPMMLAADVYDVSPSATAVGVLREHGIDPWVVDFGAPEKEAGGLERTLADHVIAVSDAVDRVAQATGGADVHIAGYSQGGMFCYQTAAYRRGEGLKSVITFGSPADTRAAMPFGLPEAVAARGAEILADRVLGGWAVPAWMSRTGFRMLDPVKSLRQRVDFVRQLHDRDALLPRERQRRFLEAEGWVAWPGPALADFVRQFIAHNRMLQGGFVIEDRLVTLADIPCPILAFVGEVDEIAPAPAVRAIRRAAPRAEVHEVSIRAGHFGLVVGSAAGRTTWPVVAGWAHWLAGGGELPDEVGPAEVDPDLTDSKTTGASWTSGLELAAGGALGMARGSVKSASRTARAMRELGRETIEQLPRLMRLGQMQDTTQVSLGLLLDEKARRDPGDILFLFEDRAHTHAAAKDRIDAVVAGLLSLGVRQGEHIGVLMETRPSALVVVAALSRLGAVAVLMRPDGNHAQEVELGGVSRIVADPEHIAAARSAGVDVLILGGGAGPRDLGAGVLDMERIDPDTVDLPDWYRPNPGRARDLAFVLFTGSGETTRPSRITNRRWALSAFGTASSGSLNAGDTVYVVTPLHHSSSLLMSLGGAVAGGARIALAPRFNPTTFWDEVRRYGVTVASYTWTMFRELADAPPHPGERHHPLRLMIGSGMPPGLWERLNDRFAPARVVEFYASTEGEAVLVNLSSKKPGAMGRPLPGAAEVRVAQWDYDKGRLKAGADGFAIPCARGETGMLLARAQPGTPAAGDTPLRGVFKRDDAWVPTGDLFRVDEDGDYWLVDPVAAIVPTHYGPAAARPARDRLQRLDAVDLAVAYGVPNADGNGGEELLVAAVALRRGRELKPADVTRALRDLRPAERPSVVHVVDEIPVTSWYRPKPRPLRAAGLPGPDEGRVVLAWSESRERYGALTAAAHKRLLAGEAA